MSVTCARLAPVLLAALVLGSSLVVTGCGDDSSAGELPSWIPEELAGLAISPADGVEPALTGEEAIATVRRKLFAGLRAAPEEEPLTFPTRITGTVHGEGSIIVPLGKAFFPRVENRLAWLVIWRGVEESAFDPPFHTPVSDEPVDFVVFVDAETGEVLYKVFLYGDARLG